MHTSQKIGLKIGLIAGQGQGRLPEVLLSRWEQNGVTPVIVALRDITDPHILSGRIGATFSIGQAGHILDFFKMNNVSRLVMVGGLKRPNFWTLRTDRTGLGIVMKLLFRKVGDDTLLRTIRREIEMRGIQVSGAHEFLPEILSPLGVLGKIQPNETDVKVIADGIKAAKQHGANDEGQSVIINAAGIIKYEAESGTNALIKSYAGIDGGILVKMSKPQQDLALDMPTIGLSTIENVHQSGLKGIAIESGKTIVLDRDDVIRKCDEYGLFLIGVEI